MTFLKLPRLARPCSDQPVGSARLTAVHAPFSHLSMKLFFAAPARAFPFLSTALAEQASRLHFWIKLVLAAPVSALPLLSTALFSQVSCAIATPKPSVANAAIIRSFLIGVSSCELRAS